VHVRRVGHRHRVTGIEAADRQHRVPLVDRDRALVALARGHDDQAATAERVVEIALLVARSDAGGVGQHPHLHEVHVGGRAGVHLRVADPAPRAHALRQPGVDDAIGAGAVTVRELALQHPGDDLHVAVRVRAEPSARAHDVVVVDDQQPVPRVVGVVV
jgi:hypothetical protein